MTCINTICTSNYIETSVQESHLFCSSLRYNEIGVAQQKMKGYTNLL